MNHQELHPIIGFYSRQIPDYENRMITEIWRYNHEQLESIHNYIQWLFPLKEKSIFNRSAPTLDDAVISSFKNNPNLPKNLLISLQLMLKFYGLKIEYNGQIIQGDDYHITKRKWIS